MEADRTSMVHQGNANPIAVNTGCEAERASSRSISQSFIIEVSSNGCRIGKLCITAIHPISRRKRKRAEKENRNRSIEGQERKIGNASKEKRENEARETETES